MTELPQAEESIYNYDDTLNRFDTTPKRETDRRTDRIVAVSISRVSNAVATRDKK